MGRIFQYIILVIALAACDHGADMLPKKAKGGKAYGGVFKWNETDDVRSIFPLSMSQAAEHRIVGQVYEGLVAINPNDLSIIPALASSWEVSEEGRVFTFHLREGVYFHDDPCFEGGKGRPVVAQDVAACFGRLCMAANENQMFWLFQDKVLGANTTYSNSLQGATSLAVEGISAPDQGTVRIELTKPLPGFLSILAHQACWIYPTEFLKHYGPSIVSHAVGTGPFKLNTYKASELLLLERNNAYWKVDSLGNQLPFLDAVKVTFDKKLDSEVAAFLEGNLSMLKEVPLNYRYLLDDGVPANAKIKFNVEASPSLTVQFYCFNVNEAPFNDVRVRQAIAMAIDKHAIADSALAGFAVAADRGIVPPFFNEYPKVRGIAYDPDSARALLAAAGYPNGEGFPVMVLQFSGSGFGYLDAANAIQNMLRSNLGLRVPISTLPYDQYYDMVETGGARFWREGWLADHPDPENFLAMFYGKNAPDDPSARTYLNTSRFKDSAFDSLFVLAAGEVDVAKRMALYAKADQRFVDMAPAIPIYFSKAVRLLDDRVMDMPHNGMEMIALDHTWIKANQ